MSTTTLMNALPKALRDELKTNWLYDGCWTDENRKTIKAGHTTSVVAGLTSMVEARQELLRSSYALDPTGAMTVPTMRDIEVLRYTLTLLDRETK
jgi:hypothetical protein